MSVHDPKDVMIIANKEQPTGEGNTSVDGLSNRQHVAVYDVVVIYLVVLWMKPTQHQKSSENTKVLLHSSLVILAGQQL